MGVVGVRKRRTGQTSRAVIASSLGVRSGVAYQSDSRQSEKAIEPEHPERAEIHEPIGSIHGCRGIQLRYHTDEGMKGEAPGYMTANNRLFLATPSILPLGASVILDASQEAPSNVAQTITGRVTSVFPVADEFGFPPGIGVSVTQGFEGLG